MKERFVPTYREDSVLVIPSLLLSISPALSLTLPPFQFSFHHAKVTTTLSPSAHTS